MGRWRNIRFGPDFILFDAAGNNIGMIRNVGQESPEITQRRADIAAQAPEMLAVLRLAFSELENRGGCPLHLENRIQSIMALCEPEKG